MIVAGACLIALRLPGLGVLALGRPRCLQRVFERLGLVNDGVVDRRLLLGGSRNRDGKGNKCNKEKPDQEHSANSRKGCTTYLADKCREKLG